ncbi:dTMP kinase [Desulfuromonas acetoxidans]|uniref:Thymidylate kinase n=1 Tax=Desulfuromonas acetoxidans (strain DSM 684 / 11070) TaxID=281689 RepID=Q1JXG9_DESA6|nr:dTMP kinase [Desulfuromonas acetoxidans]EAT14993.1 Thymidylate kinase [Desulfuromonas acetoxidans DSM 684]MBF0646126.1 dTMP kinase [Desulfuromonas acetoxidans]NVD25936.1 dTMP kinase [Desulfuromonas acetoxidans]NVE17861.1 dTMP kinase [Desulfuromonas acetoxidans]
MGQFITFEGIEGCGKTTQIRLLATALRHQGHDVIETREPGGCDIADQIRAVLLDAKNNRMTSPTELLLYAAARAQHVAEVIRPALDAGKTVLCDRFCDATLAYQGYGRQLDIDQITTLNAYACQGVRPDTTLLLDLPVEIGLGRARQRNEQHSGPNEDRFEQESLNFHQRIRQAYLQLADNEPQRFLIIDAQGKPQTVAERIASAMNTIIQPVPSS